jgi:hypothetical protein
MKAMPLFSKKLRENIKSASEKITLSSGCREKLYYLLPRYAATLPFVVIIAMLLVTYQVIPAHNQREIKDYCR